ncbi:MAG: DUF4440 domain-containing protein [Methyloceanibacter sp.]|nr:DUF4440 domain-containing protein [Methyloceanibacter sp.]
MIRFVAAVLTVLFFSLSATAESRLSDIEAINDVVGRLDEAYTQKNAEPIRLLTTKDHIAILPYRSTPRTIAQAIATLPALDVKQTNLTEPTVVMLGPASAMRTLTANFEGSFEGKKFNNKVFVTSILVKQDGKWLESFYQMTNFAR